MLQAPPPFLEGKEAKNKNISLVDSIKLTLSNDLIAWNNCFYQKDHENKRDLNAVLKIDCSHMNLNWERGGGFAVDPKSVWVGHLFNTGEGLVSLQSPLYGFPD